MAGTTEETSVSCGSVPDSDCGVVIYIPAHDVLILCKGMTL